VYAGAIMVLVIFVIMLLNVEEDLFATKRLKSLPLIGGIMGLALVAQAIFVFYATNNVTNNVPRGTDKPTMGITLNIGKSLFTEYLLPFEAAGVLLLMAIVGAMMLSRRMTPQKLEKVIEHEKELRHDKDFS
jgi:NADH:ubiquinone oxidoreductase subunit 6 (subunit J)